MTTAQPNTSATPKRENELERGEQEAKGFVQMASEIWMKANNDWLFNLSGLLAYNFLMSIFPILVALLGIAGFILDLVSPSLDHQVISSVGRAFPGGAGGVFTNYVSGQLKHVGLIFWVGIGTSIWFGSRLFVTLEGCFAVVFRLRQRDFIHQNLMAIGMVVLYAFTIPFIAFASLLTSAVTNIVFPGNNAGIIAFLITIAGYAVNFIFAVILFGFMYVIVPNRPVPWREVWIGTLIAAALLIIYEIFFPIYETLFLHPGNYGSLAGFAIVILVFFYYLGFILLLGAEINSYAAGQRATQGDLTAVLHEVQAHNTTRGAAGPTAGTPQEDLEHHLGAAAMATPARAIEHERKDHRVSVKPPKFAEAGLPGGPEPAQPQTPQMTEKTREAARRYGGDGEKDEQKIDEELKEDDRDDAGGPGGGSSTGSTSTGSSASRARGDSTQQTGGRASSHAASIADASAMPASAQPSSPRDERKQPPRRSAAPLAVTMAAAASLALWLIRRNHLSRMQCVAL